jgi:hypothetical protein
LHGRSQAGCGQKGSGAEQESEHCRLPLSHKRGRRANRIAQKQKTNIHWPLTPAALMIGHHFSIRDL